MIEEIKKELLKIKHPEIKKDIISLGMFGDAQKTDDGYIIKIKTPNSDRKLQITLEAQIRMGLSKIPGIGKIKIKFDIDENFSLDDSNGIPGVKNIIAVGSGKGGVGKSTVTANLAVTAASQGYKVGLLDSDIYGPSMGKMFGLNGRVALETEGDKIHPIEKYGIKLISFSFLINEDQPVVWRGPMLGKALEQFLYDIIWGELDYLFLDLPPGTGDVQLSLGQLISLNGAVIVTTPQNVAILDASKAGSMFQQLKIPVLGVIENMTEFLCPHCGKGSKIFSSGGGNKLSELFQAPLLGQIPLTMDVMESGESGNPIVNKIKDGIIAKEYLNIFNNLQKEIKKWD